MHFISLNCRHLDLIKPGVTVCGDGDKREAEGVRKKKVKTENENESERERETTERVSE